MSKRAILILSIAAIVLGIVAAIPYAIGIGSVATCAGAGATTVSTDCATQGAGAILIGVVIGILAGICSLIAWIGGLIKTAQIGAWVWFVLILLFTPLATLIYGFAGPETRAAAPAY